jgi:divinyl protochlorophyllide a 8-vinyl-reductase
MSKADHAARIGPNAIIQTVKALYDQCGEARAIALLEQGGQEHLITALPTEMVDEAEFHALVKMLVVQTAETQAAQILQDAGQRTARYLLAHRIPKFFQHLVGWLPHRPGLALLLWAISLNAWTFVGSGTFSYAMSRPPTIHISVTHPSVSPVAHFYGGTFAHLVQVLIDEHLTLQTSTTEHAGTIDCVYTVTG